MTTRGQRLRQAREAAGYRSARAAAIALDIPVSTYNSHERAGEPGGRDFDPEFTPVYAAAFNVPAEWLVVDGMAERDQAAFVLQAPLSRPRGPAPVESTLTPSLIQPPLRSGYNPPPTFLGARDLPVFASAECGDGSMVVNTDPIDFVPRPWYLKQVRDGYAVLLNGSSMEPAYYAGDLAVVNPKAPMVKGKDILLVGGEDEGEFRVSLKRYLGDSTNEWHLEQYNPPEGQERIFRRSKLEWPRALRVVGKYDGT